MNESEGSGGKPRLAILVNIVAPYRVPVYEALAERFDVTILYSGAESNRTTWQGTLSSLAKCKAKRSWGFTLTRRVKRGKDAFDNRFVHVDPGLLFDLIRVRPDAVISIEMGFRSALALVYGALARKPVWIWWGGTPHTEQKVGRLKRLWRRMFVRDVRRWISYGATSTEYLESIGVPRARILQIQNCVDERRFSEPAPPALALEPKPVLLVVGQLVGRKGVDQILRAAAEVQREGTGFSLALVGDGPNRPEYEALVESLGLQHVHFLGGRGPAEMPAVYRSADCLVFPTLEDVWGLVANEALWAGVPVLSSIYAGCTPELLPESNRFNPLDPEDAKAAFRRAVRGELAPPDLQRLKTHRDVAGMIADDLCSRIGR